MPLLPNPVTLLTIRTAESGKLPTAAKINHCGLYLHTPCLQCKAPEPRSLRMGLKQGFDRVCVLFSFTQD